MRDGTVYVGCTGCPAKLLKTLFRRGIAQAFVRRYICPQMTAVSMTGRGVITPVKVVSAGFLPSRATVRQVTTAPAAPRPGTRRFLAPQARQETKRPERALMTATSSAQPERSPRSRTRRP